MRSFFLSLNLRDFFKGLIVAVISSVLTWAYEAIQNDTLFTKEGLRAAGMVALASFVAYVIKNFFTNTDGEILTAEKK